MTNAIPKIYNEQTNEWVELMAKPIAKEVVQIMKEDFMKNKGPIKLLELPTVQVNMDKHFLIDYFITLNFLKMQLIIIV